jgi:steroid 5-alpha reductase family enzyme
LLAASGVLLWSARLGSFLYSRVQKHPDKRFDKIKQSPLHFGVAWFFQGLWVLITASPVFLAISSSTHAPLGILDLVGGLLWVAGFALEAVADYQKSAFKDKQPKDFVSTGVWKYSRYRIIVLIQQTTLGRFSYGLECPFFAPDHSQVGNTCHY